MASRGRHGSMNFVAMRRVRRCGLRVAFVASNNTSISFPLQCVRRCGLRTAVLHPTAHHHRCLAMHDFFFYRLTCSYRFYVFFIDWKLPPPACPGTTGSSVLFPSAKNWGQKAHIVSSLQAPPGWAGILTRQSINSRLSPHCKWPPVLLPCKFTHL